MSLCRVSGLCLILAFAFALAALAVPRASAAPAVAGEPPLALAAPPPAAPPDVTVLGALITEPPVPADSARAAAGGGARQTTALSPHGYDRCAYFLVLEAAGSRAAMDTRDAMDAYIVSNGLAVMANLRSGWAVGGGLQLYWATGDVTLAPELRVRRWFDGERSVEATLGYVLGDERIDYHGVSVQQVGPIATLRFSPHPVVFAQVGACRYHEQGGAYLPPIYQLSTTGREVTRGFGGIGFTGAGGLVVLGAEVAVLATLVAVLSGLS